MNVVVGVSLLKRKLKGSVELMSLKYHHGHCEEVNC
jgi:hypothetical protein